MNVDIQLIRKNPNWLNDLKMKLLGQTTTEVAIGFPKGQNSANAHYKNGQSILNVAIMNNFGTDTIPRRPFMEQSAPKLQEMWKKLQEKEQKNIQQGTTTIEAVMKTASVLGVAIVQQEISAGDFAPNAPETIKQKKSDKPLIDSGDMRKYVAGVVRQKGGL